MAPPAVVDASLAKLLDVEGPAPAESESEQGSGQSRAVEGGGRLRRVRAVVAASLAVLLGSTGAWLCLSERESVSFAAPSPKASRGPIKLPIDLSQRLPEMEELFALAKTVHPDFERRVADITAEHQLPNVYLNQSARLLGGKANLTKAFQGMQAKLLPNVDTLRSAQIGACMLDAWQLILGLGSIIVNAQAAADACDQSYPDTINKQNVCASMITSQLALWAFLGTYISNMWSSCPGVFSLNATRALGPVGFLSSSLTLANAGSTMAGNCKKQVGTTQTPPDPDTEEGRRFIEEQRRREELGIIQARGMSRRLRAKGDTGAAGRDIVGDFLRTASRRKASRTAKPEPVEEDADEEEPALDRVVKAVQDTRQEITERRQGQVDKQWAIAACVFDTQKAVARILQAITFTGFAVVDCSGGIFQKQGVVAKDKCIADIGLIVASLATAANMIAISQVNCAPDLAFMPDNLCAAGILNVISASGYVAVAFAGFQSAEQ